MKRHCLFMLLLSVSALDAKAASFSLVSDAELRVQESAGSRDFSGQRIFGDFRSNNGSLLLSAQADNYKVHANGVDESGRAAIVLTGNVVVSDGALVFSGRRAVYEIGSEELSLIGVEQSTKNSGVLSYTCSGTRLYRNNERVEGDVDTVCANGSYCMKYSCNRRGELVVVFFAVP